MSETFTLDNEIEQLLVLIEKDNSILKNLSVRELELLNEYLDNKKIYLSNKVGD
jgi:hypothetical protein